jgi:hypothetical protein
VRPSPADIPPGYVALAFVAFAPFLLMSERLIHFLPSEWWLRGAFLPAVLLAVAIPGILLVRKLRGADGATTRRTELLPGALAAVGGGIFIFFTILITLPAVASFALGGTTTHQVTAAMNIFGLHDSPIRGCRSRSPIVDRPSSFFRHVCFDSHQDKSAARKIGTRVVVDLHGWGNSFGIYYTSTDPVGPVDP